MDAAPVLPVLIVGLPRSGTSWLGSVLAAAPATTYRYEPDNEDHQALARWAKQGLSRFPVLAPGDEAARFALLWRLALTGRPLGDLLHRVQWRATRLGAGRSRAEILARSAVAPLRPAPLGLSPAPGLAPLEQVRIGAAALFELAARAPLPTRGAPPRPTRIVKTVHAMGAVPWLVARWPFRVIVIRRHPHAILASMLRLGWGGPAPGERGPRIDDGFIPAQLLAPITNDYAALLASASDPEDARLVRLATLIAVLSRLIDAHALPHAAAVIDHEALCAAPEARFAALRAAVGLPPDPALAAHVAALNGPGGSPYEPRRDAAVEAEKWRSALPPEQAARADDAFTRLGFDLTPRHDATAEEAP